jgi:hypothetical protein
VRQRWHIGRISNAGLLRQTKGENAMTRFIKALATVATVATLATGASAQTVRDLVGPSPYNAVVNEPPARLTVDPPLPDPLKSGIVQIQYRVENVRILPVFGAAAANVSPRIGHLHIRVDDLPWAWAESAVGNNTVDFAGVPPGPHKVRIDLVDASHRVLDGQSVTVHFTVPEMTPAAQMHSH